MDIILDNNNDSRQDYEEMQYINLSKGHTQKMHINSVRATLAAGWWFYDVFFKRDFVQKIFEVLLPHNYSHKNKKAATLKIVDTFQDQIKKNGSDARIKMFGDIPISAGWWSWLLR